MKTQHYDRLINEEYLDISGCINVMKVLANPHPETVEDYALHMFYLENNHKFFTCSSAKHILTDKGQPSFCAELIIEGKMYIVNTYNGTITEMEKRKK